MFYALVVILLGICYTYLYIYIPFIYLHLVLYELKQPHQSYL